MCAGSSCLASDLFPQSIVYKEIDYSLYYRCIGLSFFRTNADYPLPAGPQTKDAMVSTKAGDTVNVALYTYKSGKLVLASPVKTFTDVRSGPTIVNRSYNNQQINCVKVVTNRAEYYFALVDEKYVDL